MQAADWIAITFGTVSVAAAGFSLSQARTARTQALAAIEANELTRQQIAREDARERQAAAEADASAVREAQKVLFEFSGGGGGTITVTIINNSSRTIHDVELLNVRATTPGPWCDWSVNKNIPGGPRVNTHRSVVESRGDMTVATWLLDAQGAHVLLLPDAVNAEARFCDADGQWWQTTDEGGPIRVSPPSP
ncbi:hypothetical protein [Streptomyces aureocirculatus]|uniref:hypothetical protein n=1 Tax=Streptomyces aureocirculatus TaxID=67275 RepID=UPI0012FE8990|nr:hypothetical protein [Streptomyces aureocirculatus]